MHPIHKRVLTVAVVLTLLEPSLQNAEVMKSLTISVGRKFLECSELMYLDGTILNEFLNYWESSEGPHHKGTGCALLCIAQRLDLLDDEGRLKEVNARWFLSSGDADNDTISKVLDLCYQCGSIAAQKPTENVCNIAVEVAKCFKFGIRDLRWTPDVSDLKTPEGFRRYIIEESFLKMVKNETNTLMSGEDRQMILYALQSRRTETGDKLNVRDMIRSSITRRCGFYPD